jgi:hypothetical protein
VPSHSINLRLASQKGASGFQDRAERLRKGRAAAPMLREISPSATHLAVRLQFLADERSSHAEQSFVLYPSARAYFGFPCPYGDCDGIYDLTQAAQSALQHLALPATGTLECKGARSGHRVPGQLCCLQVTYTVTAQHHPQVLPRNTELSRST